MPTPRIVEMDHIVLNVRDIDASLAFYCDILGLKGERIDQYRSGSVGFPSVRINADTLIDLMTYTGPEPTARNLNHYCMVVEPTDLAALSADLKTKGVRVVTEPVSRWGARGQATSIYIADPDGNEIELRHY